MEFIYDENYEFTKKRIHRNINGKRIDEILKRALGEEFDFKDKSLLEFRVYMDKDVPCLAFEYLNNGH